MPYTMTDLIARAGVSARTIRDYIRLGYLAPPAGHGLAASYDDEQMLRVVAVARMRGEKVSWETLTERMETWSLQKIAAYVRRTEARTDPPETTVAETSEDLHAEPSPAAAPGLPPPAATKLDQTSGGDGAIPGHRYVMCPLLPGMVLMVADDAAPIVKRIALEIAEKYRSTT